MLDTLPTQSYSVEKWVEVDQSGSESQENDLSVSRRSKI